MNSQYIVRMEAEGKDILPMAEPEQEGVGLEIGDTVLIVGGQLNKTVGKLYGFSSDRMMIQPKGATDRVIRIPLIDDAPDPDLEIQEILILKKAPRAGFVSLIDLRAGQFAETFGADSQSTGIYKVISVDENTDSAVFEDDSGSLETLEFGFTGINPELPFQVIRTREAPALEKHEDDSEEQVGPVSRVAVDEDDILEEGQAPSAKEDAKGEEEAASEPPIQFALGEIIELPADDEIKEIGTADRIYDDIFQRSEMLSQLMRGLPDSQKRDPLRLQEVRRNVEEMIILRNNVVQYNAVGDPSGIKPTSINTLAELITIQSANVSLSRKIVYMSKVLYLDHQDDDPAPGIIDEGLFATYNEDIIKRAEVILEDAETGAEGQTGMPKFFLDMERYRQQVQNPYILESGGIAVEKDEEVFRNEIPNFEQPELNAMAGGETNPPPIVQVPFSITRLLTKRVSRSSNEVRIVEPAEAPSYTNVLLFPLSTLRDMGPIRSGFLAQDMSLGAMEPKNMRNILEDLGDIADFPTSESILNLGVKGNIIGNITLKDWLSILNIRINGPGDAWEKLRGYGAMNIEWNIEQFEIIQQKVEQRLAALRLFMSQQREENNVLMANLKFESNGLLAPEDSARLLSRIESEPLLQKVLTEARDSIGDIANSDIHWFSYIFLAYPDLLISVLGQKADSVARERLRHVRDLYIQATIFGYRIKQKLLEAGEEPHPNLCKHVKFLAHLRKEAKKNEDEPRDVTKVKGLVKLLNEFRGKTYDEWVWCKVCNEHLICAHELIYVQEFLRPTEKEILHKEMLIHFSGGQFSGKIICRICGQGIANLEFDQSMEFDDAGRPMMGRSVMVDRDAIEMDELDEMLKGPADITEELSFGNDSLNELYKTIKRISSGLGLNPEESEFRTMVEDFSTYVSSLPSRTAYAAATKGKKAQDFDIFYSIRYVSAAAAILLLNIQTHIPDYMVYYTSADCKDGFFGYPLEGEDTQTGIQCVASVIAGINDKEFPWNMTTLQKKDNLLARRDMIQPLIKGQIDQFIKHPIQQAQLKRKREYRTKIFGKVGGLKGDSISQSFRPVPYILSEEEAAKDSVVASAASPEKQAIAWIRAAHGIARKGAALNPDAPLSETTCCLHSVSNPEAPVWNDPDLPRLEPRRIDIPFRTGSLTTTFYTEMPKTLEGKIDPKDYYKLFTNLCWQGDNKGLPHRLGLTLTCTECGLNFKENPNLPVSVEANPKKQKEDELKIAGDIQSHLVGQGIIINEETAQDLLNIAHLKMTVSKNIRVSIPRQDETLALLGETAPQPFENWSSILNEIQVTLAELGSGATKIQIAKACEQLVQVIGEKEDFIRSRIGQDVFEYIENITKKNPAECGETMMTFLLVPFKRWVSNVDTKTFKILKSYELSRETEEDIMVRGLGNYLKIIGDDTEMSGLLSAKIQKFIDDVSDLCKNILPSLRPILTPGGSIMTGYLLRAYIMGIIQKFMDPHNIPEADTSESTGAVNMRLLYRALAQALTKYAVGSKVPTEEEIRLSLEKRAEKEKQQFIGEIGKMSRDRRKVELTMKALGMGKWAAGGSKSIRQYDSDRYEVERAERAAAGISDYTEPVDLFGMDAGDRMDGDYTDGAMQEDEY